MTRQGIAGYPGTFHPESQAVIDTHTVPATVLQVASGLAGDHERNPYWTYLERQRNRYTRGTYQGCLDHIARMILETFGTREISRDHTGALIAWWHLSYEEVASIRSQVIASGSSISRINGYLTALRGVLAESRRLGYLTPDRHACLSDIRNFPRNGAADTTAIATEVDRMLAACTAVPGPPGMRDAAIIAAMAAVGGRRDVVHELQIEDYDRQARAVVITSSGGRRASVPARLAPYIDRWLDHLGEQQGPMFRPVHRSGIIGNSALSELSITSTISRRRRAAGLATLASHDWRVIFSRDAWPALPGSPVSCKGEGLNCGPPAPTSGCPSPGQRGCGGSVSRRPATIMQPLGCQH